MQIKCPIFIAESENFTQRIPKHHYDHYKVVDCALSGAKLQDRVERLIVRHIGHESQTDFALYDAWAIGMVVMKLQPKVWLPEVYMVQSSLGVAFLHKLD